MASREGLKSVEMLSSHQRLIDVMLASDGSNFVEWCFLININIGGLGKEAYLTKLCPKGEREAKL